MGWLISILSGLISSAAFIAAFYFFGREIFKGLLARNLESFKSELGKNLESLKHDLGVDATRRQLALQSQIQFKERQLSEFYGPIYALLKRIRPIDDLWNAGKLREIDDAARQVIRESNDRIVGIILSKSHLIQGDKIPESHTHFLTHVAIWHAFIDSPLRGWPEAPYLPEAYYEFEFEHEVYATTEALKQDLYHLYQQYGIAPAGAIKE